MHEGCPPLERPAEDIETVPGLEAGHRVPARRGRESPLVLALCTNDRGAPPLVGFLVLAPLVFAILYDFVRPVGIVRDLREQDPAICQQRQRDHEPPSRSRDEKQREYAAPQKQPGLELLIHPRSRGQDHWLDPLRLLQAQGTWIGRRRRGPLPPEKLWRRLRR